MCKEKIGLQRNRRGKERDNRLLTQRKVREAFYRGSVKAETDLGWHDRGEAGPGWAERGGSPGSCEGLG